MTESVQTFLKDESENCVLSYLAALYKKKSRCDKNKCSLLSFSMSKIVTLECLHSLEKYGNLKRGRKNVEKALFLFAITENARQK